MTILHITARHATMGDCRESNPSKPFNRFSKLDSALLCFAWLHFTKLDLTTHCIAKLYSTLLHLTGRWWRQWELNPNQPLPVSPGRLYPQLFTELYITRLHHTRLCFTSRHTTPNCGNWRIELRNHCSHV